METKNRRTSEKSAISVALYAAAIIVALIGIALLITNITQYSGMLKQYVAQGYPAAEVIRQLLPNQLLPGIFQAVGLYGGIAFILFGVGAANKKASKCLAMLGNSQTYSEVDQESIVGPDVAIAENTETPEQAESIEEDKIG
jgi:hypothetical protein